MKMMGPELALLNIGQKKASRDHITAHKIALLVLIKEFSTVKNKNRTQKAYLSVEENVWIQTNQQHRDFAITTLKLIQNPDMDLKQLISIIKPILHPQTYTMVLDRLNELKLQGVAGIMDYIQSLESLLVDPHNQTPVVHKSSVLGLFLRRMLLAFDKLSFSQATKLYHKFCLYYKNGFKNDDSIYNEDISTISDHKIIDDDDKEFEDNQVLASQKQAEFFVAQQAALLQINEKEALSPPHLQQKIRELLKGNPELAEAHYLSFLNSLRVMEYCGAIENLYHHFDRSVHIHQDTKLSSNNEETDRNFRYAALNLAILHAKFGHKNEALSALKEAIMMAQEANDNICLQHALSWLYQLTPKNIENLIEHSIAKTGEHNMWYLSSLGVLALTQLKSLSSTNPAHVFEVMMKSDILNCQHSMTELMGSSYSQRAALWTLYGNSLMSVLISQLLLHLNISDPIRGGVYHIGKGTCLALCNIAKMYSSQGQYNSAIEVLSHAKELFNPHVELAHNWMLCEQIVLFERAIHHGKWQEASMAIASIDILDPLEATYRKALLLIYQGNKTESHTLVKKLLGKCKEKYGPPAYFLARILLLEAELFIQSSSYASAIPSLMKCLSICKDHHLMSYKLLTILYLSGVQFMLNLPHQALHLLDQIFINLLAQCSLYDKARAYLLYAKCLLACTKFDSLESKKEALLSSIQMISKSIDYFHKIEAFHRMKDAIYWQALVYNELGMTNERNSCSRQFRLLEQQFDCDTWTGIMIP
ncbi:anaphase-promoting complex subunit 5-like isoform X1 [Centruroides sculpturatus]|uniref:anaphase-promoting complex subunit 5-like isoform X1 n=3 Tax=Centruroides sculpturatus TaxID=218467 RepID=UPI000C6C98F5|nr:anaphase-promoting complex subunit 5-like isoform X1 [Centruroides sculpturatus]